MDGQQPGAGEEGVEMSLGRRQAQEEEVYSAV